MAIPVDDLDDNIRMLVLVLNEIPGVHTMGSCGGHVNPSPTQHQRGSWFVSFTVDPRDLGGWLWLKATMRAGDYLQHVQQGQVSMEIREWYSRWGVECTGVIKGEGTRHIEPEELAHWLQTRLRKHQRETSMSA